MGRDDRLNSANSVDFGELPGFLVESVRAVERAGGRVWVVGGAVRDALVGHAVRDWDLATTLPPDRLGGLFPQAAAFDARLGTVHLRDGEHETVFTTLRTESGYDDHRHPNDVAFIDDPAQDALRRDFTVNAIFADVRSGVLFDPLGGAGDLDDRVLRMIGDPMERLAEDPLRMLRAVRFAARTELQLEPSLAVGLSTQARLVETLSAERVFEELTASFSGRGRGRALQLLIGTGLAAVVLPEVVPMRGVPQPPEYHPEGDVLTHVRLVLDHVVMGDPVQAWSAVLHDVGKPATFEQAADRIRFHGHDVLSAKMADAVLRRLRAPNELRETVVEIARDHIRFAALPQMTRGKRERWLRSPRFPAHLAFHRADCLGSHGKLDIHEFAREALAGLSPIPPPPLCSGADVIALGVPEGPLVGEVLRRLEQELDRMPDPDRATALVLLRDISQGYVKDGS